MPAYRLAYRHLAQLLPIIGLMLAASPPSLADWTMAIANSAYYTDDVALFSVTRRLSLTDDPTQPTVDRPRQGSDFVYEPSAEWGWSGQNPLGTMAASINAGGYVFMDKSAFTHGLFEAQWSQTLPSQTQLSLNYNVVPELYLGQNTFKTVTGSSADYAERLTSHYGSVHLDQALTDTLTVRLLGRYGQRLYHAPFQHRNTEFWTLGPHLEWEINPNIELLVGYHYERGVADHQQAPHFPDNISYINHYGSAELKIQWLEGFTSLLIVDYEKNSFTSNNAEDEHYGATEQLYQGEIELLYELTAATTVKMGWQHGRRKLTTEPQAIKNTNVWLGVEYVY